MYNQLIGVSVALSDTEPGDGGFCILPGSHKSSFPCPQKILEYKDHHDLVVNPRLIAGDVLIFSEAATHGTLAWTAKHTRRTLLYKYAQKHCLFMRPASRPSATSGARLTEQQLLLFEPPSRIHAGWYPGIGASDQNPFP